MANALKKITAEAKRIRKAQPGKSWKNAVKAAGQKYRAGKIGQAKVGKVKRTVKRKKIGKRRKAKRAAPRKVTAVSVREVRAVKVGKVKKRRRYRRHSPPKKRRMAGSGGGRGKSNIVPIVLAVGAGLLLWNALKPKTTVPAGAPPLLQTSNTTRNQQSNDIVQYAVAAGLTLDAISRLIQNLNSRGDQDIQYYYDEIDSGRALPSDLYA